MADAWSTVVTREPEWDDYSRDSVIALSMWESKRCPSCKTYDSLEPLPVADSGRVTWPDGRAFQVQQYRCLACGSLEIFQRHWDSEHENDKPFPDKAMPADGLASVVRPVDQEV